MPAKKKKVHKPKTKRLLKNKGALIDKGAISVLIIMTLLIYGGYSMAGGTLPTRIAEVNPKNVAIVLPSSEPTKKSLQLYTFNGLTSTPRPSQIPLPAEDLNEPQMVDCNEQIAGSAKPQMIWGYVLNSTPTSGNQPALKIFYMNKSALLLGTGAASQMGQYYADHVANPIFGDLGLRDSVNLPYFPSIFLTDITEKKDSISGDAQAGGQANTPQDIYGSWQVAGRENNHVQNGKYLGIGADAWPPANGPEGDHVSNYSSELIWRLSDLRALNPENKQYESLTRKHEYRGQIVLRDSDQPVNTAMICLNFRYE